MDRKQILLTNDDGIQSPGLWAAAQALSAIGYVHVVAPRQQHSGAGRSLPSTSDGMIDIQQVVVNGQAWTVYAVGGSPAQAVQHAILEILPDRPDLVVSGINFGENLGTGVTISGTVGAALEAAAFGVPALAISLETDVQHHYSLSDAVDFSAAAHFCVLFGGMLLAKRMPADVDVIKVDVPCDATPATPCMFTRLSRLRYYVPQTPQRDSWQTPTSIGYHSSQQISQDAPDTDAYAISIRRRVAVTPLSLDMTSRVDLAELEALLNCNQR